MEKLYIEKTMYKGQIQRISEKNNWKTFFEISDMNDEEYDAHLKNIECLNVDIYIGKIEENNIIATLNSSNKNLEKYKGFIKNEKVNLKVVDNNLLYDFLTKRTIVVFGKARDLL